jgi:Superfamily II DNA/RNA helicases, SNF2 family
MPADDLPSDASSHWKTALSALAREASGASPGPTTGEPARSTSPLALEFELRELVRNPNGRWQRASASTRPATPRSTGQRRLTVRPVMLGPSGRWIGGNLTWSTLQHQLNRARLDERQVRWFGQIAALARSVTGVYIGQESDRLSLDDFPSALLWSLLAEAPELGIALVNARKSGIVTSAEQAAVALDATRRPAHDGITLRPVVTIDDEAVDASAVGVVGDHGVYVASWHPVPTLLLARTVAPVTPALRDMLLKKRPLRVPGRDEHAFFIGTYPALAASVPLHSLDGTVEFPEIVPPTLVLDVAFRGGNALTLTWGWEYRAGDERIRIPLIPVPDEDLLRDPLAASTTVAEVDELLAELWATPVSESPVTLRELAAAEFTTSVLPALEASDRLRVDFDGDRPDFRELTETPTLRVTTVETDRRDWFDLGVIVHVAGRSIPFQPLFTALSKGRTKLLLVDRTYLSLEQPVFDHLRELIAEAQAVDEWETGPRISRYQAGLWADFEDLADESEPAVAWRETVGGLLALTAGSPSVGSESEAPAAELVEAPSGLRARLRPYQLDGFNWLVFLWRHGLGGVLADDMGLGKTVQTLALIAHARCATPSAGGAGAGPSTGSGTEQPPFLVVAPSSVVPNWVSEAARFTPDLKVVAITATRGKQRTPLAEAIAGADIVVTSYALFRLDFAAFEALAWAGLILDEAQFVKNHASRAHRCARDFDAPFKLAITGTPMENNLMELWAMFAIVAPGLFPSARRFAEEYVRPIDNARSEADATPAAHGAERIARLRRRIRPLMMRRTKQLVAPELPPKQEQVLTIDLAPRHRALYDTFLQRERQKLLGLVEDLDRNRFIVFRSLTLLRMLALDASLIDDQYASVTSSKLDALLEQLDDVLAEGHRALVFSQFTSYLSKVADRLVERGVEHVYLDGSTRRRGEVIERFRQGEASVFLISLKAGGFGLNLTEADYVFMLDPWWNPAAEQQAIDRTHRIGQTAPVMIYRLVAADTIEEKVVALGAQKANLFDAVLDQDAAFASTLTADDLRALLE